PSEALQLMNDRWKYERAGGWNAVANVAMDSVSESGKLLDDTIDRANSFYRNAMAENQAAGLGDQLTPAQQQELGKLIGYSVGDVEGYRGARDTAGEIAGNVATTAAAVGVTLATGGVAAPMIAAGAARIIAKGALAGESY